MDRLRDRGLGDASGHFPDAGRATKDGMKALTDRLAEPPYAALPTHAVGELMDLLAPIAARLDETGSR